MQSTPKAALQPSGLSLTRPRCQCLSTESSERISLQFVGLVRASCGPDHSEAMGTTPLKTQPSYTHSDHATVSDSLSRWNVLLVRSTCGDLSPSTERSTEHRHQALIIEATACPVPGHSILIVSNLAGCDPSSRACDHLSEDLLLQDQAEQITDPTAHNVSSSEPKKTLSDLALLIRFVRKLLVNNIMAGKAISGRHSSLCLLVQILSELDYPWVELPIPDSAVRVVPACCPKVSRHDILSLIRDFEQERTRESMEALERAKQERTKRIWSILLLNLKLERLEHNLSAENTKQCADEPCKWFSGEEYHLAFHFGRTSLGESHYIQ